MLLEQNWLESKRQKNKMSETTYYATYAETEATTEDWHRWLVDVVQADRSEPCDLETICDACVCAALTATLYDEQGFVRGWVQADGNYRLT
jgi:hypothetical protein